MSKVIKACSYISGIYVYSKGEVAKIRNLRMKKFGKKNWGLLTTIKLIGIWYICVFIVSFLTSNTTAFFNDSEEVTGIIQAGIWESPTDGWDNSSLSFNGSNQLIESCGPSDISVDITNNGEDMQSPSNYNVYYIDKGNPKNGIMVGAGEINPLQSNGSVSVNFHAEQTGNYKFQAFQQLGNGNETDERQDLWSETITISCANGTNDENNEQKNEEVKQNNDATTNTENKQNTEESPQSEESPVNTAEEPKENTEPKNESAGGKGENENQKVANDETENPNDKSSENVIEEGNENDIY
jgi:YqxM protein